MDDPGSAAPGPGGPLPPPLQVDRGSLGWRITWRAAYAVVRHLGSIVRLCAAADVPTFSDRILELALVGRRTGRSRTVLVTLITYRGSWYVGHPNGRAGWLANLGAAEAVPARVLGQPPLRVRSVPLALGPERTAVILETARQQPILARTLYRAAQGHILRAGVYHRLELV
jgi:hypothetical protein